MESRRPRDVDANRSGGNRLKLRLTKDPSGFAGPVSLPAFVKGAPPFQSCNAADANKAKAASMPSQCCRGPSTAVPPCPGLRSALMMLYALAHCAAPVPVITSPLYWSAVLRRGLGPAPSLSGAAVTQGPQPAIRYATLPAANNDRAFDDIFRSRMFPASIALQLFFRSALATEPWGGLLSFLQALLDQMRGQQRNIFDALPVAAPDRWGILSRRNTNPAKAGALLHITAQSAFGGSNDAHVSRLASTVSPTRSKLLNPAARAQTCPANQWQLTRPHRGKMSHAIKQVQNAGADSYRCARLKPRRHVTEEFAIEQVPWKWAPPAIHADHGRWLRGLLVDEWPGQQLLAVPDRR